MKQNLIASAVVSALPVVARTAPTFAQLQDVQAAMIAAGGDLNGPPVDHFFGDGLYGRLLVIPAGIMLMGKTHRKAGVTVQLYGDCEVTAPDMPPQRITGWKVWESSAGTKRCILAHVPTAWLALHATEETDMDAIEADLIVPEVQLLEAQQ